MTSCKSMKRIKFDDFVRLNRGFDLPDSQIVEGIYPVVASTNIKAYHNQSKIEPPVVVTGRSGSLGQVQYIDQKCWPLNTSLYSKDFRGNHPKYVYYYLQMMHLEQYNAGAGVPTLNQNHLHNLKILVHSIEEQIKIASILSAYDSQIENNQKRIKLLEQMAESLYKEWFVRFRFPGHEDAELEGGVPKGWKVAKVKDCVNRLKFGVLYDKNTVDLEGDVIVIDQSQDPYIGFHNNAPSHVASITNPIVLFGDHSCKFELMIIPFSLAENVVPFVAITGINTFFLFFSTHKLIQTTEYKRHWTEFVNKKIFVPPTDLQLLFAEKVKSCFTMKQNLLVENRLLIKQRDLLLPRLMSGKLSI